MVFLLEMLGLTVGYLVVFTLVLGIGRFIWVLFVDPQAPDAEMNPFAWALRFMLHADNRRWGTLVAMTGITFVIALWNPGDPLLGGAFRDLWGLFDKGTQNQVLGWWHHFYDGQPVPKPGSAVKEMSWFWLLAFLFYFAAAAIYFFFAFGDDVVDGLRRLVELIRQRQAAQQPPPQPQGGRRQRGQPPAPPQAGGGGAGHLFAALGAAEILQIVALILERAGRRGRRP